MTHHLKMALASSLAALTFAMPANAAIVYDSTIHLTGQGFGNAPRILTVQATGQESACVSVGGSGSTLVGGAGACIADALVHNGNGVTNTGGDEVNPLSDNQKFGIPTIGELGWQSAADIGLLFNAVEPGGNGINILDVTLKFFNGTNFLGAIDGSQSFASTEPGNGVAGFTFVVDQAQQAYLNNLIFSQQGFDQFRIALESTLSDSAGGPDSWAAVNLGAGVIPEPSTWGMMILGIGLVGGLMRRQRRSVSYRFT